MKKAILLAALLFSIQYISYSQIPSWEWSKTLGGQKDDNAKSLACDSKGDVVMVGDFLSDSIITGSLKLRNIHPTGGVINQYKLSDIFVSKYDSAGNVVWAKNFGSDSSDYAYSVAIDNADNIIVVGKFYGNTFRIGDISISKTIGQYTPDAFIFKLDPNGNVMWAKSIGGISLEEGKAVTTDEQNNIYMAGQFWGANTNLGADIFSSKGADDIFITKYAGNGMAIWTKTFGSSTNESVVDICSDKSGHIYFTGEYRSANLTIGTLLPPNVDSSPTTEVYVSKMDVNGNIVWTKTANCSGGDYVKSLAVDKQKNVLITGRFAEYYLNIGNNIFPGDHITNPNCTNGAGLFLIKFDSIGTFKWFQTISIAYSEAGLAVKTDKDDNIFLAAFGKGDTLVIDTIMVYAIPNSATLLLKYNPDGHIIWQKTFGVGDHLGYLDIETDIDISNQGNLYLSSSFMKPTYSMDKVLCTNTNNFLSYEPFIAKLGNVNQSMGNNELDADHTLNIYPNPFTNSISIDYHSSKKEYSTISIFDVNGKKVYENSKVETLKGKNTISLNNMDINNGLYFISLMVDGKSSTYKVSCLK